MATIAFVPARIDEFLKEQAAAALADMGLTVFDVAEFLPELKKGNRPT